MKEEKRVEVEYGFFVGMDLAKLIEILDICDDVIERENPNVKRSETWLETFEQWTPEHRREIRKILVKQIETEIEKRNKMYNR